MITFACKRCNFIILQQLTITRIQKVIIYLNDLSTISQKYRITANIRVMFVNRLFVLDDYLAGQNEFKRADAFGTTSEKNI